MAIDMSKYRGTSDLAQFGGGEDYERRIQRDQAIREFDIYQQYAPNSHMVYVNDSKTPILATIQDVSDLEVRVDTKWIATSLVNKVEAGDIVTWDISGEYKFENGVPQGRKWIVFYEKEKNTANSWKSKMQPCNFGIKVPYIDDLGKPQIFIANSIIMTYLTDLKDFKQPFPTEVGTTFITAPFNDITKKVDREFRLWLYDSPFQVTGVDFTNIDFYKNTGFLKWTLRPCKATPMDNKELGICDYYNYFKKDVVPPIVDTDPIQFDFKEKKVEKNQKITIKMVNDLEFKFMFEGENFDTTLLKVSKNSFELNVGMSNGIIRIKAINTINPSEFKVLKIAII